MSSSNGNGSLIFTDLAPIEEPVTLGADQYVLREAKGRVAAQYKNAVSRAILVRDGKVSGFNEMANTDALLVSLCLFKVTDPARPTPAGYDFVNELPYKVVNALFKKAREISKLDEATDTATALRKRIADDTRKLQELEQTGGEADDSPKALLAGTKDGSD